MASKSRPRFLLWEKYLRDYEDKYVKIVGSRRFRTKFTATLFGQSFPIFQKTRN